MTVHAKAEAEAQAKVQSLKLSLYGHDSHPGRRELDCRMKTGTEVESVRVEQTVIVEVKVTARAEAKAKCEAEAELGRESEEDRAEDDASDSRDEKKDFYETVTVAQVSAEALRRHGYEALGQGGCRVSGKDGVVLDEAKSIAVVQLVQGLEAMKAAGADKPERAKPAAPAPAPGPAQDHEPLRFDDSRQN